MHVDNVHWHARKSIYSAHASVTHCRRVSPPGREGLAILALRKLHRQPYFFSRMNLLPSTGLLCQGRVGRHAPGAAARFVGQSLHTRLQKPLRPFVDKAAADPDRGSNVTDRHPISQEQDHPAPSGTSRRNGGSPLPRLERLTFRRCEADREGGGASTRHTATFSAGENGAFSQGSRPCFPATGSIIYPNAPKNITVSYKKSNQYLSPTIPGEGQGWREAVRKHAWSTPAETHSAHKTISHNIYLF